MKHNSMFMTNTDKIKACTNIIGKAGGGMKLAALMGYKFGYGMAKHPNICKMKNQIQQHPAASLMTVLGIVVGMLGLTGFLMRQRA